MEITKEVLAEIREHQPLPAVTISVDLFESLLEAAERGLDDRKERQRAADLESEVTRLRTLVTHHEQVIARDSDAVHAEQDKVRALQAEAEQRRLSFERLMKTLDNTREAAASMAEVNIRLKKELAELRRTKR